MLERLAYENGLNMLRNQADTLKQLRARTGTLLAAGSLATSFLGSQALACGKTSGTFASLGLVAFVLSIAPSVYVLVPKSGVSFALAGTSIYAELQWTKADDRRVYLQLASWLEGLWVENQRTINRFSAGFLAASIALGGEIVCWAVALAGRL